MSTRSRKGTDPDALRLLVDMEQKGAGEGGGGGGCPVTGASKQYAIGAVHCHLQLGSTHAQALLIQDTAFRFLKRLR